MKAARSVIRETGKPILAIKSGRTSAGASAAASHTGSLAGSDEVCDAVFRQAGIVRCSTIEDMFNRAIALAYQPRPRSNRVAIVTNAGGPGVMAADACVDQGLELASFGERTADDAQGQAARHGQPEEPGRRHRRRPLRPLPRRPRRLPGRPRRRRRHGHPDPAVHDRHRRHRRRGRAHRRRLPAEARLRLLHGRDGRGQRHRPAPARPHPALHPAGVHVRRLRHGLRASGSR